MNPIRKAQQLAARLLLAVLPPESFLMGRWGASVESRVNDADMVRLRGWVAGMVGMVARSGAAVPLRLYRETGGGSAPRRKSLVWPTRKIKSVVQARALRRKGMLDSDDAEEVTAHPALDVIAKMNEGENQFSGMFRTISYLRLIGESYWALVPAAGFGAAGPPAEIWPLLSQYVDPRRSADGTVTAYRYGVGNKTEILPAETVLQFRLPSLLSVDRGASTVAMMREAESLVMGVKDFTLSLISNDATPGLAIGVKGGMGAEESERFTAWLNDRHRGPKKKGRPLVLDSNEMTLQEYGQSPKDMQFSEGLKWALQEIAFLFGIPWSRVLNESINVSNAGQGDIEFMRDGVVPLLRIIEERLTEALLPRYGDGSGGLFFAFDDPTPDARDAEREDMRARLVTGVTVPDEERARLGMGERPDGGGGLPVTSGAQGFGLGGGLDLGLPPPPATTARPQEETAAGVAALNGAQVTAAASIVAQVAAGLLPRDSGLGLLVGLFSLTEAQAASMMGSAGTGATTAPNPNPAEETTAPVGAPPPAKGERKKELVVPDGPGIPDPDTFAGNDDADAGLTRAVLRWYAWLVSEAGRRVKGAVPPTADEITRKAPPDSWIFDVQAAAEMLAEEAGGSIKVLFGRGGSRAFRQLEVDVDFDIDNSRVLRAAREYTVRLSTDVSKTAATRWARSLKEGLAEGETVDQIRRRVERDLRISSRPRALMISRTETARAVTAGTTEGYRQSGVVEKREWLAASDPCEFCRALNGRRVGLDEPFLRVGETVVGAEGGVMVVTYGDVNGSDLHPNDICTIVPVVEV